LQRSWQRSWVAVIEIMPIDQKVQAPRRKGIRRGLRNWEKGPPNSGEGSSKLDRGQRRKLHPLGEYAIILIQMVSYAPE
ncbi:hypothetical protein Tco_0234614, partial [Tanacetum coccineum]